MCIWEVEESKRLCEFCSYRGGCEVYPGEKNDERPKYYIEVMSLIVGCDILQKSRNQTLVWARNMVAYRLRLDGYSLIKIGRIMGLNHTTILNSERQVKRMLERPSMYGRECDLWQRFCEEISSKK